MVVAVVFLNGKKSWFQIVIFRHVFVALVWEQFVFLEYLNCVTKLEGIFIILMKFNGHYCWLYNVFKREFGTVISLLTADDLEGIREI